MDISFRKENLILLIISILASLPIFFICSIFTIKIIYFTILVVLIIFLYEVLEKNDRIMEIQINLIKLIKLGLSSFFLFLTIYFFFLINLDVFPKMSIYPLLSLLFTSFLPGFSFIHILRLENHFSNVSMVIFSFIFSYIFSGFVWLIMIIINFTLKIMVINFIYLFLALFSFLSILTEYIKTNKVKFPYNNNLIKISKFSTIGLAICLIYYFISFLFLYPKFTLIRGIDISRHYKWTYVLTFKKENYKHIVYILFHAFQSLYFTYSNYDYTLMQSTLVLINLLFPLVFYELVRNLFKKKPRKYAIISTLTFTFLMSIGGSIIWILFFIRKITEHKIQTALLMESGRAFQYSIQGLWFIPLYVNLLILFALFSLFTKPKMNKKTLIIISTILIYSLFLGHIAEGTIFILFLSFYILFSHHSSYKQKELIIAAIIGALSSYLTFFCFTTLNIFSEEILISFQLTISMIGSIIILIFSYLLKYFLMKLTKIYPKFNEYLKSERFRKKFKILIFITLFIHFISLIFNTILDSVVSFLPSNSIIKTFSNFTLPLIFLTFSLLITISKNLFHESYYFGFISVFFCFIFGLMLYFMNTFILFTGYNEIRLFTLGVSFISFNSPIFFYYFNEKIDSKVKWKDKWKLIAKISLISLISLFGFSIIPLNIEFWVYYSNNPDNLYPIGYYDPWY